VSKAVIGLGFGDEGKGLTTDLLCSGNPVSYTSYDQTNKMVVRYSGGQQAGHTVVTEDHRHVFSTFGSGTMRNVPTFWSRFCSVDPIMIVKEASELGKLNHVPILFLDPNCPVTTPYERAYQQEDERCKRDGTCGHGVGATFKREEDFYHLVVRDIYNPKILRIKMEQIDLYYSFSITDKDKKQFMKSCKSMREMMNIKMRSFDTLHGHNLIFEGSQGLLLDQHIGFFPNVTRSNTGTKNILSLGHTPELYLVTRAYQTRHGNGPMTNQYLDYEIQDNPMETNVTNKHQGEFHKSMLDVDLLFHGISSDRYILDQITNHQATLVITCLDHLKNGYSFTLKGKRHDFITRDGFITQLANILGCKNVLFTDSPNSAHVTRYRV